jgi:hypothetical protein
MGRSFLTREGQWPIARHGPVPQVEGLVFNETAQVRFRHGFETDASRPARAEEVANLSAQTGTATDLIAKNLLK